MKKRTDRFERQLRELYDITEMLEKEGKSDGERRYKELVATILLFIDDGLRMIGLALFGLLGFIQLYHGQHTLSWELYHDQKVQSKI